MSTARAGRAVGPARLRPRWVLLGLGSIVVATVLGVSLGPVSINPLRCLAEILDTIPGVSIDSGLSDTDAAIVRVIRFPRVVLGLLVGGLLALSGAAYQGVFRNPLADPYLLGIAAGAGLGATFAIVSGAGDGAGTFDAVPVVAFVGALLAVAATFVLGSARGRMGSPATLILAGVAVASFFTALQTYVQQRDDETLRLVYSWILGRLSTTGWGEVAVLSPYAAVSVVAVLAFRGHLDVLAVGDDEAATLGLRPRAVRAIVVIAASLAAAAAVAVSGLIGFVGLIVPHAVRLVFGTSNRIVVPLSLLFGASFLALADLLARTVESPAELPIGVVTAFFGAPFFLLILRRQMAGANMTTALARGSSLDPTVSCEALGVRLGGRLVLRDIDLAVTMGEWLAVIGPNGAGKSTLLRALVGLVPATGAVRLGGQVVDDLRPRERARLVALVPQVPVLPGGVSVLDYVLLGRTPHQGFGFGASDHDLRVALAVLQRLDLEGLAERAVDRLSGGERQRAVVARALAQETPILLLDEPTTSLDIGHQLEVLELIDDLRRERSLTVLTTLHDLSLAGQFCDRLALLVDGDFVADGPPVEVLRADVLGRYYGAAVEVLADDQGVAIVVRRHRETDR